MAVVGGGLGGHDEVRRDPFWTAPALGLSALSRVRLDELLKELLDRVGDVMASRERLSALLEAVVGIGTDLDLRSTLQRIVAAACRLADAKYGALGIIGPDRGLVEFITDGVSVQERQRIGEPPHGRGVLGLLIDEPHPVRLKDISEHPRSFGFPPNHPLMKSFLGVPVRVRDQVYGNLYLTEKRGAEEFTGDDEEMILALSAAAGVAIDNARLYAAAGHRERWLEATAEITNVLTGEVQRTEALGLVARRAREVSGAARVLVLLASEDREQLTVEVADPDQPGLAGATLPVEEGPFGSALATGEPVAVEDLGRVAAWPVPVATGTALVAPLSAVGAVQGLLVVAYPPGGPGDELDVQMLSTFAAQAALALERARAQEERELLLVLEDRERIARDLHDVVIQRLFATGLHLQSAARLAGRPEVAERIHSAVDDLDATIRDIRSAIFELRAPVAATLRVDIRSTVDTAAASLGFRPELVLEGPVDSAVPDELRTDVVAAVREALSNVVKHAHATTVSVHLAVGGGRLRLLVADNGVGTPASVDERSGLVNLRERATRNQGTMELRTTGESGITVDWSIPI
ncbi:MAG: GAF domain-containing protein [Micromonosporaceae bacterium]|nr:GAF domain-containing protein [Micromonosporaceae bacterium]